MTLTEKIRPIIKDRKFVCNIIMPPYLGLRELKNGDYEVVHTEAF